VGGGGEFPVTGFN